MSEKKWFNRNMYEIEGALKTDLIKGITQEEVKERIEKNGYNELEAGKKKTLLQKFIEQFKNFSVIILIIAAIVSRNIRCI